MTRSSWGLGALVAFTAAMVAAGCDRGTRESKPSSGSAREAPPSPAHAEDSKATQPEPSDQAPAEPKTAATQASGHPVMAAAFDGKVWTFIDTNGNKAVDGEWPLVRRFSSGLAAVNVGGERSPMGNGVLGGHYEYIDPTGTVVVPGPFIDPGAFWHHRLVTVVAGKKVAVIDSSGKEVASGFDALRGFYGGLSYAKKGDEAGFLKPDGQWAFSLPAETKVGAFNEGLVAFSADGKTWGFLDVNGKVVIEPAFERGGQFWDGASVIQRDGKFGYIDTAGEVLGEVEWDAAVPCHEKRCAVLRGDEWGYVDNAGKVVIEPQFEDMRDFHGGKAAFLRDGKVGYIDPEGTVVIEPQWEAAYDFHFGRAVFSDGKAVGYIDDTGAQVIAPAYVRAERFVDVTAFNEEHRSAL